ADSVVMCDVRPRPFDEWYGRWVSKDLYVYVAIPQEMSSPSPVPEGALLEVCVKGGSSEGSVYLQAITIDYEKPADVETESPLGYQYEKVQAKETLNEDDVVMLYRSGNAATDIDGIAQSGYLDAMGIASTSNVYEYGVERFRLRHDATGKYWTLTDQWDRQLGANSSRKLRWNEGETAWSIQTGYDGATITSANESLGTLRFNAPAESYARFALYTSKTLPLPYLYKQKGQNQPVLSGALILYAYERTVNIQEQDTMLVHLKILPANATDFRLKWRSTDESVASVRDGIVTLHQKGEVCITARSVDSGVYGTLTLHVVDVPTRVDNPAADKNDQSLYRLDGVRVPDETDIKGILVTNDGRKQLRR
ncbi:MAG: hypothetical protein HUK03_09950, partial [Bacteroidaceae bacterium]|nr:hypothetical protein [Bacteroidaceae bacterium]